MVLIIETYIVANFSVEGEFLKYEVVINIIVSTLRLFASKTFCATIHHEHNFRLIFTSVSPSTFYIITLRCRCVEIIDVIITHFFRTSAEPIHMLSTNNFVLSTITIFTSIFFRSKINLLNKECRQVYFIRLRILIVFKPIRYKFLLVCTNHIRGYNTHSFISRSLLWTEICSSISWICSASESCASFCSEAPVLVRSGLAKGSNEGLLIISLDFLDLILLEFLLR